MNELLHIILVFGMVLERRNIFWRDLLGSDLFFDGLRVNDIL